MLGDNEEAEDVVQDALADALKKQQPEFSEVDNPGNWPEYCYRPKFKSTGKSNRPNGPYEYHALPTGVTPVPQDDNGNRFLQ